MGDICPRHDELHATLLEMRSDLKEIGKCIAERTGDDKVLRLRVENLEKLVYGVAALGGVALASSVFNLVTRHG
jgi:hypothetical protein